MWAIMLNGIVRKVMRYKIPVSVIGATGFFFIAYLFDFILCSRVLAPDRHASFLFSLCVPLILFALCALAEFLRRRFTAIRIEWMVCFGVLVLGVVYSLVLPPFVVPDELSHFYAAYNMSDTLLFMRDVSPIRVDDLNFVESIGGYELSGIYYGQLREWFTFLAVDPTLVESDLVGAYNPFSNRSPQVTFAPALGFAIARLIGLGTIPMIYLGRFFNLLYFIALLFFALRILPQGKRILAVVAFLPMTLQQVSSLSYDAGILGMSFLLFALIMKAITGKGILSAKEAVGILVVSTLLAPCKVVYSLILLLVLFIPKDRFKSRRQGFAFKALVFFLPVLCIALASLVAVVDIASSSAPEAGGRGYSLYSIFERPGWFLDLLVNTLYEYADDYLFSMLGNALGSFQEEFYLPISLFLPFIALLTLATVRLNGENTLQTTLRSAMLIVFFGVVALVILSMLLAFTHVGNPVIEGVQGRYFLPVLPLLLFGLQGKTVVANKDYTYPLIYSGAILSAFVICINFSIAIAL